MTKTRIFGYLISAAGTALWLYGYFTAGSPSLVDWHTHAPWWIAKYLPNLQAETGMALMLVAMVPMYWPRNR